VWQISIAEQTSPVSTDGVEGVLVDVGEMEMNVKMLLLWQAEMSHAQVATVVEFETGRLLLRQLRRETHDFKLLKRSRMPL